MAGQKIQENTKSYIYQIIKYLRPDHNSYLRHMDKFPYIIFCKISVNAKPKGNPNVPQGLSSK